MLDRSRKQKKKFGPNNNMMTSKSTEILVSDKNEYSSHSFVTFRNLMLVIMWLNNKKGSPDPSISQDGRQLHWPKGFTALAVGLHVVPQGRRLTLSKTVDIHDGHQVVELVVGGEGHGLPHRALWALAITEHAVHTVTAWQWRRGMTVVGQTENNMTVAARTRQLECTFVYSQAS